MVICNVKRSLSGLVVESGSILKVLVLYATLNIIGCVNWCWHICPSHPLSRRGNSPNSRTSTCRQVERWSLFPASWSSESNIESWEEEEESQLWGYNRWGNSEKPFPNSIAPPAWRSHQVRRLKTNKKSSYYPALWNWSPDSRSPFSDESNQFSN